MIGTVKFYFALALVALGAGCQQPTSYAPSDIAPSQFILGLIGASEPSAPVSRAVETSPLVAPAPVNGGVYVFEDSAAPVVYTEQAVLAVDPVETAPIEVSAIDGIGEPAFVAAPTVDSYVEQAAFVPEVVPPAAVDVVEVPNVIGAPLPALEGEVVSGPVVSGGDLPILDAPVLDAPVLGSTEILESELAPVISEAVAPPKPTFTPIPQPGLAGYGQAF